MTDYVRGVHDEVRATDSVSTSTNYVRSIGDSASVIDSASATVMRGATAVVGASPPQPQTIGEAAGVLGWIGAGMSIGYGYGHDVFGFKGGVIGGALGAGGAITSVRWRPAREATFRFIRWLSDKDRPD